MLVISACLGDESQRKSAAANRERPAAVGPTPDPDSAARMELERSALEDAGATSAAELPQHAAKLLTDRGQTYGQDGCAAGQLPELANALSNGPFSRLRCSWVLR